MKIVYCILGIFNSGGMERVLANKVNYLVDRGYDVSIITTDQKGRPGYFNLDSRILHIDLAVNYTDALEANIISKSLIFSKKKRLHKQLLAEQLMKLKPDITISMFDYEASFLTDIKDGSAKVLEIHFSRFKRIQYGRKGVLGLIDRYLSLRDKQIAKKYKRFVVLTHEDKGYWGKMSNIEVIPNANSFEPNDISNLSSKRVIAVGRLNYQKRFEDLIALWRTVHLEAPDWKLEIFGNGPQKKELQALIDTYGLSNSAIIREPVKDIMNEYLTSSMVAMTSRYEGLPMALLEGQVCGLPMVSYCCKCGPKDIIIDGKNGFLIDEGDLANFSSKIVQLIKDVALRKEMGLHSSQLSKRFSEEEVMSKWISLFNSVV
ncbi:glycosyltransferase family 4 protein [Sphingobacterium sp. BN32]|uniref:glycosyltransferase family 4 protein n=1 Tax=Sphingobacterium sp. BN32 TaxID=3058432 RepID=UPI00265CD284|nr:glycosyltransferase family 4 protein [Sphingobacterium sp. BN32]WKK59875.1 glycosyltransferase family 4 protein [Sphingobacterium sp. BN32]